MLQSATIASAGTYTIAVGGLAGTTGGYELQLILNAAVETEEFGGNHMTQIGTAQSLATATLLLDDRSSRAAVLGIGGSPGDQLAPGGL